MKIPGIKISQAEARRAALMSQGLLHKNPFGVGQSAVYQTIAQLGYIQIDTISVVERAHHHVLHSRIDNYHPDMLHQLQSREHRLFEYWSHAAAYLPMVDYRFYLPVMKGYKDKKKVDLKWRKKVLARIKSEGPLQSRDFENLPGKKSGGWWDWKPAKLAMENLFLAGELLIKERRGFQKVFDLPENVIPDNIDKRWPSPEERGQFYIRNMLNAHGFASARQIAYNRAIVKRLSGHNIQVDIDRELRNMVEEGEVVQMYLGEELVYCLANTLPLLSKKMGTKRIRFLSPFDNLVINRQRLTDIFNFDYLIECYVPSGKRKFGYFTLPMLYGDKLIGRIDCKADRKKATLLVHNIWLEEKTSLSDRLISALNRGLIEYSCMLNCDKIILSQTDNPKLKKALHFS